MRKLIFLLFLFTSAKAQVFQKMTQFGYEFKRIKVDSTLHIPSFCGVPTLHNSTAKEGAIAMDTCNNLLYKWTRAAGWSAITGGGGGASQDLSSVLNVGNKGYKNIELLPVNGSNNSVIISPNDNDGMPEITLSDSLGQSVLIQSQTKYDLPAITFEKNTDNQALIFNNGSLGNVYMPDQRYDLPNSVEDTLATLRNIRNASFDSTFLSDRIDLKLNIADTENMLNPYLNSNIAAATYQPIGSYATTAQLATKLNITDTANKWVNNITRELGKDSIIYYIGSNRYAIKDSVGVFTQTGRFGNDTATIVMAKVHNDAGVQLTNGKVVYLGTSGTSSDVPSVRLANNKADSTSANTFGFVSGTINVNDTGWIVISGKIEKLNTSAFSNGDIIYLDSISGNWTKSKPVAPYHMVYLGVVVKANAGNGSIFVKCQNGFEADEIHDFLISGKVNNNIIVYSDTQKVWKNRSIYSVVDTVNTIATKSNVGLKVNISDTASMLNPYSRGTGAANRLPFWVDTRTLSSAANYTISSTLSSPYLYVTTTSGTAKANITPTSIFSQKSNDYSGSVIDTTNNLPYLTAYNQTNNRESRLYPTYFSFKNLTSGSTITVNSPSSISNRTINFQDKSYTIGDSADIAAKIGGSGTTGAIAKFTGTSTIGDATAGTDYLSPNANEWLINKGYEALGSSIKGVNLVCPYVSNIQTGVSNTLTSQQPRFVAVYLPKAATITGVKWYQITQGVYTANNYNGVGLYSYSGGTLTLVASSTDDGTIWKSTANTWGTKAFSSTYSAAAGIYFICAMYNTSAQTTQPAIGASANSNGANVNIFDFTNSAKLSSTGSSLTTLPSTQAMSGLTVVNTNPGLFLY